VSSVSVVVPFVPIEGSTVGALAARFDIVLSAESTIIPISIITNTTDPARNAIFRSGDSWRIDVHDASAASPVFLHFWEDNVDLGVSGPHGPSTDSNGTWTLSGSFGAGEVGSWQLQVVIGTATSLETSAPIAFHVSNA
jgi:hypothetical protein